MTEPYDWAEDDDTDYRGDDHRRLKIGAAIAAAAVVAVWAWTRDNQPEQATLTGECVTAVAPTPAPVIEQFTINVAEPSPPVTGQPPPPVDLETSVRIVGGDR